MTGRLTFHPTKLAGLVAVQRKPISDERGFFERLFCSDEVKQAGLEPCIFQINRSYTRARGVVRGLHFQHPPFAETKIITCLRGSIFDVAVDLRAGSPTFLRWHAEELSSSNNTSLLIPPGFAHGFQSLEDDCELLYFSSAPYTPEAEAAVNPLDPKAQIAWPLNISAMSERDRNHPFILDNYSGIVI